MKKILLHFIITISVVACFAPLANAAAREINEVYIEATGNNKHEAKIKAHELGMQRALMLVADQLKLKTENIGQIPYERLREVFKPVVINDELSLKEKYNATVSYQYSPGRLFNVLLDYGGGEIDNQFFEYIVIPAFKQSSFINIWEPDKRWNDLWDDSRKLMFDHRLYYPKKNLVLANKITSENLFNLKYDDFVDIFKHRLFKGVIIVTAEFFTNRRTRDSIMQVNTHVISSDGTPPEVYTKEYPLRDIDDIPYTVETVVDRLIDDFGNVRYIAQEKGDDADDEFIFEDEPQPIIMNFDVYDPEELDLVVEKLENVEQIDSFRIEHDYNTRYKILIYTNVSEYELAEGLYLNGLSYRIHGQLYNLIDVKKGG